jgi:hypothetical protein
LTIRATFASVVGDEDCLSRVRADLKQPPLDVADAGERLDLHAERGRLCIPERQDQLSQHGFFRLALDKHVETVRVRAVELEQALHVLEVVGHASLVAEPLLTPVRRKRPDLVGVRKNLATNEVSVPATQHRCRVVVVMGLAQHALEFLLL